MSEIDPTDYALATIASILDHPETGHAAESPAAPDEPAELEEQPLAPEPAHAHGYSKVGPGPMEALRFKWIAQLAEDGQYYVHETIGDFSTPIVSGPMSAHAAIMLVDERESEAHHRFEALRSEISGRRGGSDVAHDGGEA